MQFHLWKTHFEKTNEILINGGEAPILYEDYKKAMIHHGNEAPLIAFKKDQHRKNTISAELSWLQSGKPYYNILPNIMKSTLKMKLDKIPVSMLSTPLPYQTVSLRFSKESEHLENILVFIDRQAKIVCLNILHNDIEGRFQGIMYINLTLSISIEEYINRSELNVYVDMASKIDEVFREAIRYYALISFLNNYPNEELIQFDVTEKLRNEFTTASKERKEKIIELTKRSGRIGWNIGVNEHVLGALPRLSGPTSDETGRELSNAHIRTGHLHCVRFGANKEFVKVMWFRPTVVRADLPFKE